MGRRRGLIQPVRRRFALERVNQRFGLLLVGALVIGTLTASAALAGGKHASSTSTAGLQVTFVNDANGDGKPNHYDTINFTFKTAASQPLVGLRCYQGSDFIYDAYVGYYPGYWAGSSSFYLANPGYWVDGVDAGCKARLFHYDRMGRERIEGTLTFPVGA
jgi:hypothetical protein